MKEVVKLLKNHREDFFKYENQYQRNFPLFAEVHDELQVPQKGWDEAVPYFPYYRLSLLDYQFIQKEQGKSMSIYGTMAVENKLYYYATARHYSPKMISLQRNFDHIYKNDQINVFDTEENFVTFLFQNKNWWKTDYKPSEMLNHMKDFIQDGLLISPPEKGGTLKNYEIRGTLVKINAFAALAENMY